MDKYKELNRGTGALAEKLDPRNYQYEEVFGVAKAAIWKEKGPDQWKRYGEIRDQYTSGSCVGQTLALVLGIENQKEEGKFYQFSARSVYARNFVAPDGGMYPSVGFKYVSDSGLALEIQLKSQLIDEMSMRIISDEAKGDQLVAKIFKGGKYISINPTNTDAIANILDQNKGVGVSVRFDGNLQPDKPKLNKNGKYGHEITLVDYCLFNGIKGFVYQNSWGKGWGFSGLGFFPLDQFEKGCDSTFYFEDFANTGGGGEPQPVTPKPKHEFKKNMKLGDKNVEVSWLQMCLAWIVDEEGQLFPLQDVGPTGYFGGITRAAVKRFQKMNGLVQTGEVGVIELKVLNDIFK